MGKASKKIKASVATTSEDTASSSNEDGATTRRGKRDAQKNDEKRVLTWKEELINSFVTYTLIFFFSMAMRYYFVWLNKKDD
mmetsp:Transcript_6305/g.9162  ORF Transcript_6305/g.9162 Transcript_6305/m.9162 type:complete len:82 (-) Transcript_6305:386-631(-)|eukprot:CAMPEP_0184865834 /NCGR_PEP_ID=MMETSP0580-20130426/19290_1 /TAXON_ID=1118495 /ORGANISM="Dactyliosolen fragilissimus" /LENGTH=81 /DNA_ID=CAMNT_0027365183 /DNA_START=150 /DNA_END=395 /DNA_ORIENTATION=-